MNLLYNLSYAPVSSFWHAQGCHETCSPPRNWTTFHTPPMTSMKKLLHWWHASEYIQRRRTWTNLGFGMPLVQQTSKSSQIYRGMKPNRINEHLQPQLSSRGDYRNHGTFHILSHRAGTNTVPVWRAISVNIQENHRVGGFHWCIWRSKAILALMIWTTPST